MTDPNEQSRARGLLMIASQSLNQASSVAEAEVTAEVESFATEAGLDAGVELELEALLSDGPGNVHGLLGGEVTSGWVSDELVKAASSVFSDHGESGGSERFKSAGATFGVGD